MLKHFNFECQSCSNEFSDYVEGVDGQPEACPACEKSEGFKKLSSGWSSPTTIIVDYPGSKRLKAGYVHQYNRPAEKKGSQVSMHVGKARP
jgi:hypothetical protein